MTTQEKRVNIALAIIGSLILMGLFGELTRYIARDVPTHTTSLKQTVQPCYVEICVMR